MKFIGWWMLDVRILAQNHGVCGVISDLPGAGDEPERRVQGYCMRLMVTTEKASIHPHIHRNIHQHLIYPKVWIPMRHINCLWPWALLQITMWPVTPYGRAIDFNEADHGKPLKQVLVVCCITAPPTGDLHVQYIESEIDISLQGIPTYIRQA